MRKHYHTLPATTPGQRRLYRSRGRIDEAGFARSRRFFKSMHGRSIICWQPIAIWMKRLPAKRCTERLDAILHEGFAELRRPRSGRPSHRRLIESLDQTDLPFIRYRRVSTPTSRAGADAGAGHWFNHQTIPRHAHMI